MAPVSWKVRRWRQARRYFRSLLTTGDIFGASSSYCYKSKRIYFQTPSQLLETHLCAANVNLGFQLSPVTHGDISPFLNSSASHSPAPPPPPLPSLRFELMFHNPPTRNENQPSFQNSAGFCEILFSLPPTVKILFLSKSSFNTFIFQRPFSTFSPSGFSNTCVCFFFSS